MEPWLFLRMWFERNFSDSKRNADAALLGPLERAFKWSMHTQHGLVISPERIENVRFPAHFAAFPRGFSELCGLLTSAEGSLGANLQARRRILQRSARGFSQRPDCYSVSADKTKNGYFTAGTVGPRR